MSELNNIHYALEKGDLVNAGNLLTDYLTQNCNDAEGWTLLARFCIDTERPAWAYPIALKAAQDLPNWRTLTMLGAVQSCLQMADDAIKTLKKALKCLPENEPESHKAITYRLMASAQVQAYKFDSAEHYAKKALEIEDHYQAHTALAFAYLHQRKWKEGWKEYTYQLGRNDMRVKHDYGLPEWQGQRGKVLVYGDQGLGDQIAYMSANTSAHQINCHPKLKNLFQRTFPGAEVYGDMFESDYDWALSSDYQTSMASAMQWQSMERRGAYLKPHYDKSLQWGHLLAAYGVKPKIGIAWTGGKPGSDGFRTRNLTLEDLLPILKLPYTFVSLEYRDRSAEITAFEDKHKIKILDFPWGTQTDDYDDTAALVDCLDAVITVPTTAYHLAGGLGIPACVLVHDQPHFHEGTYGPSPWWESVDFIRRPEHDDFVDLAAQWLTENVEVRK